MFLTEARYLNLTLQNFKKYFLVRFCYSNFGNHLTSTKPRFIRFSTYANSSYTQKILKNADFPKYFRKKVLFGNVYEQLSFSLGEALSEGPLITDEDHICFVQYRIRSHNTVQITINASKACQNKPGLQWYLSRDSVYSRNSEILCQHCQLKFYFFFKFRHYLKKKVSKFKLI